MLTKQKTSEVKAIASREPTPVGAGFAAATQEQNSLWQSLALSTTAVQPKLAVSQPDDPCEQEADRIADRVMRMATPQSGSQLHQSQVPLRPLPFTAPGKLQRKCAPCADEEEVSLQRKAGSATAPADAPPLVHETLKSPGQRLDPVTRSFMEERFDRDFGEVRVHADTHANASAQVVSARAYTIGNHLVFGAGQFKPETTPGRKLIAHELAHTIQQRSSRPRERFERPIRNSDGNRERATIATSEPARQEHGSLVHGDSRVVLARDGPEESQAGQSEVDRLLNQIVGVLSDINEVGAEVEFTIWASHGAITLVSTRRIVPGRGRGQAIDADAFIASHRNHLPIFIGTSEGYIQLVMQRSQYRWTQLSFERRTPVGVPATPPEGRTVPVSTSGTRAETFIRASEIANQIYPLLLVPSNGTGDLTITLDLDDDRIPNWNYVQGRRTGTTPTTVPAGPETRSTIIHHILPLTSGLGRRTARFVLHGTHTAGDSTATWRVQEAGIVRPPTTAPNEADQIVSEYRQMHEQILVQWRQGVRDAAVYASVLGAEQLAVLVIGNGILGAGRLGLRAVAPRLSRLLGPALETLFARLGRGPERAEFSMLVAKVEAEGIEALSAVERTRFRALAARFEQMLSAPLADLEKDRLRSAMVARFEASQGPAAAAFRTAGRSFEIHHRVPLEWSHLRPGFDVNAGENLIGLDPVVHRGVNAVWTRLRRGVPGNRVTPQVVEQMTEIIDRHFVRWYNQVPTASGLELTVQAAKDAARAEVDALILIIRAAP